MNKSMNADIIPFPRRDTSAAPSGQPSGRVLSAGEIRLIRALSDLNDALIRQRTAMAAWKASLSELRTVSRRLGASMRTYNDGLGRLDARVQTLRSEALKLEALADEALDRKG